MELHIYFIGDSGGPIHQWVGDHWIQVGIVSFGKGCADAENPGIYTRLSFYHDWLDSNTDETGPITYGSITTTVTSETTTTSCIVGGSIDGCGAADMIEINLFFILISLFITFVYLFQ